MISGPVGAGKTAAVKTLASENGFNCKEWSNPIITSFETLKDSGLYEGYVLT